MKKWSYLLSTNTIWASFDNGEVEAETKEEAREKAKKQIAYDLKKVNDALNHCDITYGFSVEMDLEQIEIELIEE